MLASLEEIKMLDLNGQTNRPSMKTQLKRLKDQYPDKRKQEEDRLDFMEFDADLPRGQAPALTEQEQSVSEPTGTQKRFQEKKLAYKDLQYGQSRRGR